MGDADGRKLEAGMMAAPNVRLERKLRDGGMGSIWVALHTALSTRVAVKFMQRSSDPESASRFSKEAEAAAQIKSPHVVQVFDHGTTLRGDAYIVMELLEGEDLATKIERATRLPLAEVVTIVSQTAKALSKAHQLDIVHRDVKPENLFLLDVDGETFVKVLDFGVAKQRSEVNMSVTTTGIMMGTPYYMAPEQMAGAKNAVPASDMWSLGVVAYQALTGALPFDGETVASLAVAIERGKFAPPSTLVSLPPAIDAWFARTFAHDPTARFATVKEMAETLARAAGRTTSAELAPSSEVPVVPEAHPKPARSATMSGASVPRASAGRAPRSAVTIGLSLLAVAALGLGIWFATTRGDAPVASSELPSAVTPAAEPGATSSAAPIVSIGSSAAPTESSEPVPSASAVASASAAPSEAVSAAPAQPTWGRPSPSWARPSAKPTASPSGTGTKIRDRGF